MPGGSFDLFFQGMGNRPGKGKRKHANAAAAEAQPSVHLGPRVKEAAAASRKEFSQAKITRALSLRPGGDSISQLLPLYYEVDWSDAGKLGSGHFATVYRGRNRATGQLVAMKKIKRELTRLSNLQTEVSALRKVTGHPNIVQLYDVYYNSDSVVLVLEMLGGGELFDRICDSGAYTEWDAANHCRKIATALAYMHANGIVHRDLKPENLVLADRRPNSEIKISDFGLSKILNDDEQTMKTVCGTRAYSAPEVNFGGGPRSAQYTEKVDSWSLGVILFVILVAYHPFGKLFLACIWYFMKVKQSITDTKYCV
mmetsp:Transcript_13033/g.24150  ORF Transcript_13033/g.24150 Transcript_13033/m.24150 type:complete len:312 (+) Transcript_13033:66-1001(+)